MKDLIKIIHDIINSLLLINNYVLLDNNNTMNYYYNNNFTNIQIIHNLDYINLLNLINELNKKKIKLLNNFYNYNKLKLIYKDNSKKYEFFIIKQNNINNVESNINFRSSKDLPNYLIKKIYRNFVYYDIIKLEYIYNNKKVNLDEYLYEIFYYFKLDNDILNLIELIIFYLKNSNKLEDKLKNIIEIRIDEMTKILNNNNILKNPTIKDTQFIENSLVIQSLNHGWFTGRIDINAIEYDYTVEKYHNINKTLILLKDLEFTPEINRFELATLASEIQQIPNILNKFIKYDIINNILFDVKIVNRYDLVINTIEEYILLILLEKYIIINKKLFKYNLEDAINYYFFKNMNILEYLRKLKESLNTDIIKTINNFMSNISNDILILDKFKIKIYINMLTILFFRDNSEYNNISIKIAYIYKLYNNIDINTLRNIFNIYNEIINKLEINDDYKIEEDNFIYKMIKCEIIKEFVNKKMLNIPIIAKKFNENEDIITILDYQDAIIILYENIYNNKLYDIIINNEDLLEDLFNSILLNIKSNKNSNLISIKRSYRSYNIITDNIEYDSEYDNIEELDNDEELENKEELKYKEKYKKIKIKFTMLKMVKNILISDEIDKNILNNYDEINDELIKIILEKYNNDDE
jgi:hypothetical protein